jgi:drug/metabolite transporter (DMT)-like permease
MHTAPLSDSVALLGRDAPQVPLWIALIWLAVMGSFVPMWLSYRAMHHLTPTAAGIASTSETVFAFGFGFLMLGETFSSTQIIGGILVLAGIVTAQLSERQEQARGKITDGNH